VLAVSEKDQLSMDVDEEEEEEDRPLVETKIVEETAIFDEVMIWGHEKIADAIEDPYTKGMEEWITFAEAVSPIRWPIIARLILIDAFYPRSKVTTMRRLHIPGSVLQNSFCVESTQLLEFSSAYREEFAGWSLSLATPPSSNSTKCWRLDQQAHCFKVQTASDEYIIEARNLSTAKVGKDTQRSKECQLAFFPLLFLSHSFCSA
jgi:hypothetical protein